MNSVDDEDYEEIEEVPQEEPDYQYTDDGGSSSTSYSSGSSSKKTSNNKKSKNIKENVKNAKGKVQTAAGNVKSVQATGEKAAAAGTKGAAAGAKGAAAGAKGAAAGARVVGDAVEGAGAAVGSAVSAIPYVGGAIGGAIKGGSAAFNKGAHAAANVSDKAGDAFNKASDKLNQKSNKLNDKAEKDKKKAKELKSKGKENQEASDKFEGNLKKDISNPKKLLIKTLISLAIVWVLLLIFIAEQMIAPLMEAFQYFDAGITEVADFHENLTNFYNGFGFQNTKEAFYDELNYWYDEYDKQLDVPLLLATLYYTETTQGYDSTNFGSDDLLSMDIGDIDGFNSSSMWSITKSYLTSKYKDSFETVGEDGLNYTTGKIIRMRKLARHQFPSGMFGAIPNGEKEEMTLEDYIKRMEDRLSADILELIKSLPSALTSPMDVDNALYKLVLIVEGEENAASLLEANSYVTAITQVLKEIAIMAIDVSSISINNGKIVIYASKYKYDGDEYRKYLMEYYIEKMPEFQELLPSDPTKRAEKKEEIINNIYQNRDLFKEIFLQYVEESSEEYVDSCIGAIDGYLISDLQLPVKIPDGKTVSFDGNTAFGIRDGKSHKGVDLNSTTAGVNNGDSVYAIASGEVIASLPDVSCNSQQDKTCKESQGAWVKIKHNIVVDNKEYTFYSVYMHLQTKSGQPDVGAKVAKGDIIGKVGNTGDSSGPHLHFEFRDSSDVAIDPTNLFISCSSAGAGDFSAHKTTLTKEQFVSGLKNYCNNNSCSSGLSMFVNNAELIYDNSKSNNVNPEFVIVRAMSEGFSPGGSTNNYWGIGCTNTGGLQACHSYSSLTDGIKGLASLSIVKDNENVSGVMSKYAYIGEYWYNPGSWGSGGCPYFPYIRQYMTASRVQTVDVACGSSKACSGSSCLKTIDEDQKAYATWQVDDKMNKNRKAIWGFTN